MDGDTAQLKCLWCGNAALFPDQLSDRTVYVGSNEGQPILMIKHADLCLACLRLAMEWWDSRAPLDVHQ